MGAQEINRQIATVRELLSERPQGLQAHVARVLEEAFGLAKVWDVSKERLE